MSTENLCCRVFAVGLAILAVFDMLAMVFMDASWNDLLRSPFVALSLVGATMLLWLPTNRRAASMIVAAWVGQLVLAAISLASRAPDLTDAVRIAQIAFIASAATTIVIPQRAAIAAAATASGMMLLFGSIHLTEQGVIAAIIPEALPLRQVAPILSGLSLVIAGCLVWPRSTRRVAMIAVGGMFLSWLPIVHLPRLTADPANLEEWRFAAMALVLAGALFVTAGGSKRRDAQI